MTPNRPHPLPGPPLLSIIRGDIGAGDVIERHHHRSHMIAWAATATATVRTDSRDWLVPPTHALWIPAGTEHAVEMLRPGDLCAVVVDPNRCSIDWPEPTGVRITPVICELIVHLDRHPDSATAARHAESLVLTLLEPVPHHHVPGAAAQGPPPARDRRRPHRRSWRTHIRMRAALTQLARGTSVGATARAVGYRKPSAFAATFHRVIGQHPSIYHPAIERPAQVSDPVIGAC
ncbi:helix-turn-helix domain-containing protein [Nocardia tengchongensis]|uniref:helix-turn-helix domain-containing protein n=1 Tax=Nocardia tengchongensis TaxID=2055889 RepID=UPI0036AA82E7